MTCLNRKFKFPALNSKQLVQIFWVIWHFLLAMGPEVKIPSDIKIPLCVLCSKLNDRMLAEKNSFSDWFTVNTIRRNCWVLWRTLHCLCNNDHILLLDHSHLSLGLSEPGLQGGWGGGAIRVFDSPGGQIISNTLLCAPRSFSPSYGPAIPLDIPSET